MPPFERILAKAQTNKLKKYKLLTLSSIQKMSEKSLVKQV